MDTEDAKIVSLCNKNSRDGFEQLYSKYCRYVYTLCYRITLSREDAADLMQEVFLKVYRNMESFRKNNPLLPWIRKIAVNTCINHKTRSHTYRLSFESDSISDAALADRNEENDPESASLADEQFTSIEKAVSLLPPDERTAVILRHYDNKSYDEIATIMECPIGTIKTYLFRGRRMLRERLTKEGIWEV